MGRSLGVAIETNNAVIHKAFRLSAVEIGNKVASLYKTAIQNFYSSWSPNPGRFGYDRTNSLYLAGMGVGGRNVNYLHIGKLFAYDCGINVGPEFYEGNPYAVKDTNHGWPNSVLTNDFIFPRAFDKGIHGFTSFEVYNCASGWRPKKIPKKSEPPRRILNRLFKEVDNEDYVFDVLEKNLDAAGAIVTISIT